MSVPSATYRLQLHRDFTLDDARALVPYLAALGISHLYLSPVFQARAGSTHGYDVTDPTRVSEELGGEAAFRALAEEARRHGLGLVLDIVPNHMAADPRNAWWRDVLRFGRASPYAGFFDIDWEKGGGQVRLPILGRHYTDALDAGELGLVSGDEGVELAYFDARLPLDPATVADTFPAGAAQDDLDRALAEFDVARSGAAATDRLDALIARQAYQPVFWKMAAQEMNYRRFFDIGDLVGVRVEDPAVFEATHALALRWVRDGTVDGLRIDHVDGLADPTGYLQRLAEHAVGPAGPAWIVVEKILARGEALRADWPIAGTTGYDFLNAVGGLFIDARGMETLREAYRRHVGGSVDFHTLACEEKKRVIGLLFAGEMRSLEGELAALAAQDRRGLDLPGPMLGRALLEATAQLPVYRTYLRPGEAPSAEDRAVLARALGAAADADDVDATAVAFVRRTLCGAVGEPAARERFVRRWQQFTPPVMAKGVEDTALYEYDVLISACEVGSDPGAPAVDVAAFHRRMEAMAAAHPHTLNATSTHDTKRGEDVRARLDVLSELADEWADALPRWSAANAPLKRKLESGPAPDPADEVLIYQTLLGAWPTDPSEEANFAERIREYLTKAAREAKRRTSWYHADEAYEAALHEFATAIVEGRADSLFRAELDRLRADLAFHGVLNGLSQLVIKAAAPGVPDFYQGTELWTLSLVDPDNRRAVDYDRRRRLLDEVGAGVADAADLVARPGGRAASAAPAGAALPDLLREPAGGRVKLRVTAAALAFRRERADLFREGAYLPLEVDGERAAHVVAFARRLGESWALTVAPRLTVGLARGRLPLGTDVWGEMRLRLPDDAPVAWRNVLTGEEIDACDGGLALADLFMTFPAAILAPEPHSR